MFEKLKDMAMQQLATKMESNSLNDTDTQAAAADGANGIMDILQSKIGGGKMDEVMALFSGGDMQSNGIFAQAKAKMAETLQAKGMNAADAGAEATNATSDVLSSLKDKFLSKDAADSDFNLDALTNLIPGGAGDLLNKAKNIFGK